MVDSEDLAASPPAVAVEVNALSAYSDESVTFEICHSTTDGSTLSAYWAFRDATKLEWMPFMEDEPIDGPSSTIEFWPPAESVGSSLMVQIIVTERDDER